MENFYSPEMSSLKLNTSRRLNLNQVSVRNSLQKVRERRSQLLIDEDQLARNKVEDYEKRLSKVMKNKNRTIKSNIDRIQQKEAKRQEALQKYQNQEKAAQK